MGRKKQPSWGDHSVQILPPANLSEKILTWCHDNIPEELIYSDPENPGFGREYDIHITILNGIHSSSSRRAATVVEGQKRFECVLGDISCFTNNSKFDVLKIDVFGEGLYRLNGLLSGSLNATVFYKQYIPHITMAYMKKGAASYFSGGREFLGEKFLVTELVYSSRCGKQNIMRIGER